ncbi:hypothetical protein [Agromyces sp. SYSU T00194]|uniref:hypothetical protein n=1 Tax=Agromyces chitinivorans TaxID=3158560 RepID=UPI003394B814
MLAMFALARAASEGSPQWLPDWLAGWLDTISALEALLWLLGLGALIYFAARAAQKFGPWAVEFARAVINTAKIIDSVKGLPDHITKTDQMLADIHHETHTNNGSSIKDIVSRIESSQKDQAEQSAETNRRIARLEQFHATPYPDQEEPE